MLAYRFLGSAPNAIAKLDRKGFYVYGKRFGGDGGEKMRKYDSVSLCPKCGCVGAFSYYCDSKTCSGHTEPVIVRNCKNCRYEWYEESLDKDVKDIKQ